MTWIDLPVVNDYGAAIDRSVLYAKGERIVQQGQSIEPEASGGGCSD